MEEIPIQPIKAVVHLGIEPVPVPSYAKIFGAGNKDPMQNILSPLASCVAWHQLGADTIEAVCKQFRADLYKMAAKELPPESA